ncbi:MAG: hypothetical protein Q8L74_13170 [Nitrospirota bacterium]|nr:hypothetical protein [Nitrospirota bacterium]
MSSAAITEIQREIVKRQGELEHLQAAIRRAPILQEEIRMLQGSLALLSGGREIESPRVEPQLSLSGAASSESLSSVVRNILRQAGKPLSPREIVPLGAAHGRSINYGTLTSMMAKQVNQGKDFIRDRAGKYALREWETSK